PLFLPDGLTLGLGDAPPRAVAWRTCDAAGCEALAPLENELLAALRRERAAEVTLTLVDGVRVRLPVSLMGFTAAWEALGATREVTPP
nr:invasion associated locus B family protein [Paracoccaceae bacterium]